MPYYVYENWVVVPGGKAIIHLADCGHCNDGEGKQPGAGDKNGRWWGPYITLADAQATADATGRRLRRVCSFCARRLERGTR